MKENRVRVGVVKYGDAVEIPVALGDYDHSPDLLARIGDTRRMRGEAHLGHALRDVASEFLISGITGAPRVVIVFKSGPSVYVFSLK
uniref:VWFA domain-containing protein n=1 Tax=Panagrolaimus superbus TaxID=310955 RepID=A0A914YLT5_9BILA